MYGTGALWGVASGDMASPSFLDAYVVVDSMDRDRPLGVVRRTRHVWRIYLFGVPDNQQPQDEFERREAAGEHVLHLAAHRG